MFETAITEGESVIHVMIKRHQALIFALAILAWHFPRVSSAHRTKNIYMRSVTFLFILISLTCIGGCSLEVPVKVEPACIGRTAP